jgi:hypothetical protein
MDNHVESAIVINIGDSTFKFCLEAKVSLKEAKVALKEREMTLKEAKRDKYLTSTLDLKVL